MFDDPGKELKRLEKALREEDPAEQTEETDELDLEALLEERPAARDFSRTMYDEPMDENAMVPDNDPKPRGIGGLVALAVLAGIAAALWWTKWRL